MKYEEKIKKLFKDFDKLEFDSLSLGKVVLGKIGYFKHDNKTYDKDLVLESLAIERDIEKRIIKFQDKTYDFKPTYTDDVLKDADLPTVIKFYREELTKIITLSPVIGLELLIINEIIREVESTDAVLYSKLAIFISDLPALDIKEDVLSRIVEVYETGADVTAIQMLSDAMNTNNKEEEMRTNTNKAYEEVKEEAQQEAKQSTNNAKETAKEETNKTENKSSNSSSSSSSSSFFDSDVVKIAGGILATAAIGYGLFKAYEHFSNDDVVIIDNGVLDISSITADNFSSFDASALLDVF